MWKYDVLCGRASSGGGFSEFMSSALAFSDVRFGSLAAVHDFTIPMSAIERKADVPLLFFPKNFGKGFFEIAQA